MWRMIFDVLHAFLGPYVVVLLIFGVAKLLGWI